MERWFEIYVKSVIGPQCSILAKDQAEANQLARDLYGDNFSLASDPCLLPEDATLLWHGYSRARQEREWLLWYMGRQVHIYEQIDSLFPLCRFIGVIPGRSHTSDALCFAAFMIINYDIDPEWFTNAVKAGRCYYPTGYKP